MLQDQKVRQDKKQDPASEDLGKDKEAQAYSQEFLSAMIDYAFNSLDDYLKKQGELQALELLNALMQLHSIQEIYKQSDLVLYVWNNEASYAIGSISKIVPKFGGHFIAPSGIVLR